MQEFSCKNSHARILNIEAFNIEAFNIESLSTVTSWLLSVIEKRMK